MITEKEEVVRQPPASIKANVCQGAKDYVARRIFFLFTVNELCMDAYSCSWRVTDKNLFDEEAEAGN